MARTEAPQDPRPYVRISTDLPLNPKLAELDNPAAGWVYVVSICYAGQSLTDGHVPVSVVARLAGVDMALAMALAEVGLWHLPGHECGKCPQPKAGSAYIHDYLQHQRSADEAKDLTSKRREAGRKGAAQRWSKPAGDAQGDGESHAKSNGKPIASAMANGMASAMANGWQSDSKPMAEERRGEKRRTKELLSPDGDEPEGFAEFWAIYPPRRNSSKADARKAYAAALKAGADPAEIIAGAKLYADSQHGQDSQFTAHAKTWLHGKRWEDALAMPSPAPRRKFAWEN